MYARQHARGANWLLLWAVRRYGGTAEWEAAVTAVPQVPSAPRSEEVPEGDCCAHGPEPEPEPITSYPLYVSGSDSDDSELLLEAEPVLSTASMQVESTAGARLAQLIDMGFKQDLAERALHVHPASVEAAAAWLLQGNVGDSNDATESLEVPVLSEPSSEEWRVDPVDGNAYTQADFVDAYGGLEEWNAAIPNNTDQKSVGSAHDDHHCTPSQTTTTPGVNPESMEAYVLRGLKTLCVDDDLCDYFVGMMEAMAVTLEENGSTDGDFDEGIENLASLLVDGYGCDEAAARSFIANAPGLASELQSERTTAAYQHDSKRSSDLSTHDSSNGPGGGVRRVRALPGASKMNVGIDVTDWVDPEEQPWA